MSAPWNATYSSKKVLYFVKAVQSVNVLVLVKSVLLTQLKKWTKVQDGDVLVSDMTDPDWEPVMKRAAAIITNRGGRTCHAAIIARRTWRTSNRRLW